MRFSFPLHAISITIMLMLGVWIGQNAWSADPYRTEIQALDGDTHVTVSVYPGPTDFLLLWIPPAEAAAVSEKKLSEILGAGEIEVWMADFFGGRFLSPTPSNLRQVPAEDVTAVIEAAYGKSQKAVFLVCADHAAGLALRAAVAWQARYPNSSALVGAILWHPQLYTELPRPGSEASLMEEVHQVQLPLYVFQPKLSPRRWRFQTLISAFEASGAPVSATLLPGLRDGFFIRQDSNPREDNAAKLVRKLHYAAVSKLRSVKQAETR